MRATVYGIPGSHPVKAGLAMLDRKGIEWKLTELPPVAVRGFLRARGFEHPTVPAVRFDDGRRVQTTRELSRELDRMVPEPPLFPGDPARRAAVEAAEQWGDEIYQPIPRRLSYYALKRDRSVIKSFMERPLLGVPPGVVAATGGPVIALGARINRATDESSREDLAMLPALFDRVDALIADGTLRGEEPNAADFQIAVTTRLLMNFDDIRPAIEGRPLADHATSVFPAYPGHIPAVFPAHWLQGLRATPAAS